MTRRIGIFAHSTNPRGGVVHAMQLAEALWDRGEDVTLLAPAPAGATFFRTPRCPALPIPAAPVCESGTAAMVAQRIREIARFLSASGAPRFDIHHAQDPITANALADLADDGRIGGFLRTVHHLDSFADPRLAAWQERGFRAADALCCVSRLWQERLAGLTGREPTLVGNGVDQQRFSPVGDRHDGRLRERLRLPAGPVLLALGGIEARKNTLAILQAFLRLRIDLPDAHLLVAGGATLLEHGATRAAFGETLRAANAETAVTLAGIVPDEEMPALYRLADMLVSPSLAEGFGLVPLEAMACGRPAIVSAIAPFTEHLGPDECLWADPTDTGSIADAMRIALDPATAQRLSAQGPAVAARFNWDAVARRHLDLYGGFTPPPRREALLDA